MPKGKYDTPGPFYTFYREDPSLTGHTIIRRKPYGNPQAQIWGKLDEAECDELVGLLNKGTHFDEMLAALKEAYGLPDYVGIDETEVGEKELVVSCEIWRERWGEMIAKLTGPSTD